MAVEGIFGTFLAVTVFAFGIGILGAGLFTAYFGAGKSRTIGFTLSIVGVLVLLLFAVLTWALVDAMPPQFVADEVVYGLAGVLGAAVGGIVSLIVFLASIMKA